MAESKVGDSTVDSHVANAIEELAASGCELIANWTNEGARQSEWSDSLFLNHSSDLRSRTSHGDPEASGRESIGWLSKEGAGMARNPIVSVAVPPPMARNPSVSTPWWWRTGRFGYESWRGSVSVNPCF